MLAVGFVPEIFPQDNMRKVERWIGAKHLGGAGPRLVHLAKPGVAGSQQLSLDEVQPGQAAEQGSGGRIVACSEQRQRFPVAHDVDRVRGAGVHVQDLVEPFDGLAGFAVEQVVDAAIADDIAVIGVDAQRTLNAVPGLLPSARGVTGSG